MPNARLSPGRRFNSPPIFISAISQDEVPDRTLRGSVRGRLYICMSWRRGQRGTLSYRSGYWRLAIVSAAGRDLLRHLQHYCVDAPMRCGQHKRCRSQALPRSAMLRAETQAWRCKPRPWEAIKLAACATRTRSFFEIRMAVLAAWLVGIGVALGI